MCQCSFMPMLGAPFLRALQLCGPACLLTSLLPADLAHCFQHAQSQHHAQSNCVAMSSILTELLQRSEAGATTTVPAAPPLLPLPLSPHAFYLKA